MDYSSEFCFLPWVPCARYKFLHILATTISELWPTRADLQYALQSKVYHYFFACPLPWPFGKKNGKKSWKSCRILSERKRHIFSLNRQPFKKKDASLTLSCIHPAPPSLAVCIQQALSKCPSLHYLLFLENVHPSQMWTAKEQNGQEFRVPSFCHL